MASFVDKVDYFGLTANSAPLEVLSDEPGIENQFKEYNDQGGAIIDSISFGTRKSPKNELALTGDWTIATNAVKFGGVTTVSSEKFALGELSISTTAGELPSVSASGRQVPDDSSTSRYFVLPATTVKNDETAQILWTAFTLTGSGCHLQSVNYKAGCDIVTKDKDGLPLAFGVAMGYIECEISIVQCGSAAPTVAAGEGWAISKALNSSNPDSDVPTWSCTLRKPLAKTVPTPPASNS